MVIHNYSFLFLDCFNLEIRLSLKVIIWFGIKVCVEGTSEFMMLPAGINAGGHRVRLLLH